MPKPSVADFSAWKKTVNENYNFGGKGSLAGYYAKTPKHTDKPVKMTAVSDPSVNFYVYSFNKWAGGYNQVGYNNLLKYAIALYMKQADLGDKLLLICTHAVYTPSYNSNYILYDYYNSNSSGYYKTLTQYQSHILMANHELPAMNVAKATHTHPI